MKRIAVIAAVAGVAALAGCQTNSAATAFFGTSNPCDQATATYQTFLAVAEVNPKVAKYGPQMKQAYAAVRGQCSDGDISKVTMQKLLAAYLAAMAAK